MLTGCTNTEDKDTSQGCDGEDTNVCAVTDPADMSAYEGFMEAENQFVSITMQDAIDKIKTDASGIFYIGYPNCPWCIEAVPVMNEIAKENGQLIYYVDKKAESSSEASIEEMTTLLDEILTVDSETNEKKLYVPEVFILKDGDIVANNMGTVSGHDAKERKMNEEEIVQLKDIYKEMFAKLK